MFNTTPAINHGRDKFAERNGEIESQPSPIIAARKSLTELAERGNPLANHIVQIEKAMREKKRAEGLNEEVPAWVREKLQFLDEYQESETENLDDALAALSAAL